MLRVRCASLTPSLDLCPGRLVPFISDPTALPQRALVFPQSWAVAWDSSSPRCLRRSRTEES